MSILEKKENKKIEEKPFVSVAIVAAGNATRMQGVDKQFIEIGGVPVLLRTIMTFANSNFVDEIIVATKEKNIPILYSFIKEYNIPKIKDIVCGGETRAESVASAIKCVAKESNWIAIHDGARPLVTECIIEDTLKAAFLHGAAATGVRVKDTIKKVDTNNQIVETPNRNMLWAVHTPQIFKTEEYVKALQTVPNSQDFTDDCKLMEEAGTPVYMVEGSYENMKITTPEDIILAEAILKGRENDD